MLGRKVSLWASLVLLTWDSLGGSLWDSLAEELR